VAQCIFNPKFCGFENAVQMEMQSSLQFVTRLSFLIKWTVFTVEFS